MFTRIPFSPRTHLSRMIALAHANPDDNLRLADLPYRLSSWALDNPANVALWADPGGELAAWAVLQVPFWTLDFILQPGAPPGLLCMVLDWADQAAIDFLDGPFGRPCWFIEVFAGQTETIRVLEDTGWVCQADAGEDSWSKVLLGRSPGMLPPAFDLPPGFHVRPLAGQDEVEAYVSLHQRVFETTNMRPGWRARTLHHPDYLPGLDLVMQAPDGQLAAFCIGWLDRHSHPAIGQIEPMGVHPEFRQLGLGRAILDETLRRMVKRGAQRLLVETDAYRDPALELYESAGFRVLKDVLVFRKAVAGPLPLARNEQMRES